MSEQRPPGVPGPKPSQSYPVDLKWEDPGTPGIDDLHLYRDVLRKIEARPGQWARVRVMTQSSAYSTRKRLKKVLQAGDAHWDVTVSRVPGDTEGVLRGLYVRYRTDEQLQQEGRQ